MKAILALSLALTVFSSSVLAQNDFDAYPIRPIAFLVKAHDTPENKAADFVISADPFPSKTLVTFTGEHRPISKEKRDFLLLWLETRNLPKSNADSLVNEYRFVEGNGVSFWLPVVSQLEPFFDKELKKDDLIVVFYFFVGGYSKKAREWVFVAEEFHKSPASP